MQKMIVQYFNKKKFIIFLKYIYIILNIKNKNK